jgi:1,4-alpha-glucan branching enzyme
LLAAVPALGTHAAFRDFVELAHEQEIGVVWDISLQAILAAHGLPAQKPLSLDLPALGGPLISIVLGCIGYWHQHLHIDGFRLRDLDLLLGMPVDVVSSKRGRRVATGDNPFAREWLGQLLTQIRARFPSLLLLAETEVVWPELTLPCSKGGFGFDYRLPATPALVPNVASEAGLWLQRSVQSLQDGNRLQQLLSLAPLADADPDLQQVVLLALWSLPGRKHLRLDCQLRVGSNWQPERGHDWEVEFATTLCEARKTLLRDMNFLYQGSPSLYEQDASHEGISVLHSSPTVLAFERIARHGSDAVLVVINTGETDCDDLRLRPTQVADYRLCCRGGRGIAGAQSLQLLRKGGVGELLVSVPACSAAVYSTAL